MTRFTHGIATASWIDKAVHLQLAMGPAVPFGSLPVNDGLGPPPLISRPFFKACQGFRFANFLEVGVKIEGGRIVQGGFTPDSRGYFSGSFMGHPAHAYSPKRTTTRQGEDWVFKQIVGARTTAQEEVGGTVGKIVGTLISPFGGGLGGKAGQRAARTTTPFAPIWSELEIRVSPNGSATGRLHRFSLFPSLNYYEQQSQTPGTLVARLWQKPLSYGPAYYNAVQRSQQLWFESGWGALRGGKDGPTPGNPWGVKNNGSNREVN